MARRLIIINCKYCDVHIEGWNQTHYLIQIYTCIRVHHIIILKGVVKFIEYNISQYFVQKLIVLIYFPFSHPAIQSYWK